MNKMAFAFMAIFVIFSVTSCDLLDTKEDLSLTDDMLDTRFDQMFTWGYRSYGQVYDGFTAIDGNLFAGVSDEAQYVTTTSSTQRFNEGSWNAYSNPDNNWSNYYKGIHAAYNYLDKSVDYKDILARGRDLLTSIGMDNYLRDVKDVERLRAEQHVLIAWYYFELAKRYGGVPLVQKAYEDPYDANLPRATFEEVIDFIVAEIDGCKDELVVDWKEAGRDELSGRITKGAALAVKARALLYAASPQFNPENNTEKWEKAAAAAAEIIAMNRYSLHPDYGGLFVTAATTTSPETIWAVRMGQTNKFEHANYPISTQGGATGVCPTQNLVDAYEHKGAAVEGNPYANLDPRFYATVVKNDDDWNGRKMAIYEGGQDDPIKKNTSPTGYYLRKFLNPNLNLTNNASELRSWIIFRYAEVLLDFAESMNEAYGPDDKHGYTMSAREAVNAVRGRQGVQMPAVVAEDADDMRLVIKHERMVELAFEDHRYWDLRRWDDAETVLNEKVRGVRNIPEGTGFRYEYFDVAQRVFKAPAMNLYPIPQAEIVKSKNVLTQNPGW